MYGALWGTLDASSLHELNLPPFLIYMPFTLASFHADGTAAVPEKTIVWSYRQTSKGEGQGDWVKNTGSLGAVWFQEETISMVLCGCFREI